MDEIINNGLGGAMTYGAIGAVLGFAYKLLEQARSKKETEKEKILKKFPILISDIRISKPLGEVLLFSTVCPKWVEPFCAHLEFIWSSWEIFYHLDSVDSEKNLIDFVTRYLPQYELKSNNRHHEVQIVKHKVLDEIEALLEDLMTSRTCVSGLMAELTGLVGLFNVYWDQVGNIIMEDEYDNEFKTTDELWNEKLDLYDHMMSKGGQFLYKPKQAYLQQLDKVQKQYIQWWLIMHTAHLPSMRKIARLKKLNSVFNPSKPSPNEDQNMKDRQKHHKDYINQKSTKLQKMRYYASRIQKDSLKDVVDEPKRGQKPAIDEPCYLPTVILKQQKLIDTLVQILSVIDTKISFMISVHGKLNSGIFTNCNSKRNQWIAKGWNSISKWLPPTMKT